jgi:hypothetical protein
MVTKLGRTLFKIETLNNQPMRTIKPTKNAIVPEACAIRFIKEIRGESGSGERFTFTIIGGLRS